MLNQLWTYGNLVYDLKRAPKLCGCYLVCSHVPQLLLIKFTQWNMFCIGKSTMKYKQRCNKYQTSPNLDRGGVRSAHLLVSQADYISPPIWVHYWLWSKYVNWRRTSIFFTHVSYHACSLVLTKQHINQI